MSKMFGFRWAIVGGVCLALAACGGDDSGDDDSNQNGNQNSTDDDSDSSDEANEQNSNQQSSAQSECSGPSDCEEVVCDCPDGPVNFTGCNVRNGVGTCATESTCASAFGACD